MNKREQKRVDAISEAQGFCEGRKAAFTNTPAKNGDAKFLATLAELGRLAAAIGNGGAPKPA